MMATRKFMRSSIFLGLIIFFIGLAQSYVTLYPYEGIVMSNIMLVLGTIVVLIPCVTYLLSLVNKYIGDDDKSLIGLFLMYSIAFVAIFCAFGLVLGLGTQLFSPDHQILLFDKSNEITTEILNSKFFWAIAVIAEVIISTYFIFQTNKSRDEN